MKRNISLLLCLALLLSVFCMQIMTAFALEEATIKIEKVSSEQGESVSVPVLLENNPGIMFLSVTPVCYDSENNKTNYLSVSVSNGDLFSITNGKNAVFNSSTDVTEDGLLCVLNIDVAENTPVGTYTVTLIFRECYNSNEENVEVTVVSGLLTVEELPIMTTGVTLNKHAISINIGESELLSATVFPDNATNKNVIWTSDRSEVASVDNNGNVTAIGIGTATITVKTEDGNFTDACVVNVVCSHVHTTVYPAKKSTCSIQGNSEYTFCNDCGTVISGSDEKLPLAEHVGGTATCHSRAMCGECGQEYGEMDFLNHEGETELRNSKTATLEENGYTGDIFCVECDSIIEYGKTIYMANNMGFIATYTTEAFFNVTEYTGNLPEDIKNGEAFNVCFTNDNGENVNVDCQKMTYTLPNDSYSSIIVYKLNDDGTFEVVETEIGFSKFNFSVFENGVYVICTSVISGDANCDGVINGKDLIRVKKYLNGEDILIAASADVDNDGEITEKDLSLIVNMI